METFTTFLMLSGKSFQGTSRTFFGVVGVNGCATTLSLWGAFFGFVWDLRCRTVPICWGCVAGTRLDRGAEEPASDQGVVGAQGGPGKRGGGPGGGGGMVIPDIGACGVMALLYSFVWGGHTL